MAGIKIQATPFIIKLLLLSSVQREPKIMNNSAAHKIASNITAKVYNAPPRSIKNTADVKSTTPDVTLTFKSSPILNIVNQIINTRNTKK